MIPSIWPHSYLLNTGDIGVCKEVTFGPILSHVLEQVPAAFDIKSEVKGLFFDNY